MRIESGPAWGDRIYFLIFSVICVGLFGYFMYDWQIGYYHKNEKKIAAELSPVVGGAEAERIVDAGLPEEPTSVTFEQTAEQLVDRDQGPPLAEVTEMLGSEPVHVTEPQQTSQGAESTAYFASRYGVGRVLLRNGQVAMARNKSGERAPETWVWGSGFKSKSDIEGQLWWGLIPLVVGLYALYRTTKAWTLRAVVDERGLQYRGELIPYDQMTALRDFNPKGWIDLYYSADDQQKKLRLDNQKIARFDEIVAAICDKKGYDNQVAAHADKKRREEAEAEAEHHTPTAPSADSEAADQHAAGATDEAAAEEPSEKKDA